MDESRKNKENQLIEYMRLIEKQTGKAVRPYRTDGYVNVLNKYGTEKDSTEHYEFDTEPIVPDMELEAFYEGNGLFAKIIDAPAEEALSSGFEIDGLADKRLERFYREALDDLNWEETAITSIKWARLFGGCLAVMIINDGRLLDQPVDWKHVESIDDIRIYDRSVISPDYASMYTTGNYEDPYGVRGSRLGSPEYYLITSLFGTFRVHESRCLIFQNGVLPEKAHNFIYRTWGIPEYVRIHRAIRDSEIAHGSAVKMLDRSIQAVYTMRGLANELATNGGEERVLKRLQTIDMARGLLNSITIDADGEGYDFRQFSFTGVSEVIDTTCNYLSALTNIPQTILFGRSPAGMNSTGESDLENWYKFVGRIQTRMLKQNLRYLLCLIFQVALNRGEIDKIPEVKIKFNPLWSLTEEEQISADQQRANIQQAKAATTKIYVDMGAINPKEVRKALSQEEEFDVEKMLDGYSEEELEENAPQQQQEQMDPMAMLAGNGAENAQNGAEQASGDMVEEVAEDEEECNSVGVIVIKDGYVLAGRRKHDDHKGQICGPGGKVEPGESLSEAAARETREEFGINPRTLVPIGEGPLEDSGFKPKVFLCTEYDGRVQCDDEEMTGGRWISLENLLDMDEELFPPFKHGLAVLMHTLYGMRFDAKRSGRKHETAYNKNKVKWVTMNGTHVPIDEDGEIQNEKLKDKIEETEKKPEKPKRETKPRVKKKGAPTTVDPSGENKFKVGFSDDNLRWHWEGHKNKPIINSHKNEFPEMTMEEYGTRALELVQKPVGGDILGHAAMKNGDAVIIRFDKKTGEFVKGDPEHGIITFFKAKFNEAYSDYNEDAYHYYLLQLDKDNRDNYGINGNSDDVLKEAKDYYRKIKGDK